MRQAPGCNTAHSRRRSRRRGGGARLLRAGDLTAMPHKPSPTLFLGSVSARAPPRRARASLGSVFFFSRSAMNQSLVDFSTSERPRCADAKQACAELRMARGASWETGAPVRALALEAQP